MRVRLTWLMLALMTLAVLLYEASPVAYASAFLAWAGGIVTEKARVERAVEKAQNTR